LFLACPFISWGAPVSAGDSTINAQVSLPQPCIAPIVFVTGPTGTDVWFAVTGS
jgi:hypothetical protein